MPFRDHFSSAEGYARFRPDYPIELFDFLAGLVARHELALDCATGSGQAARGLVGHFDRVLACDASAAQIARATGEGPRFAVARAETLPVASGSVDLLTVAQALHWLEFDDFYREVRRVCRPGAVVAAWTYSYPGIRPGVDRVVRRFGLQTLASYWPPERKHTDELYARIPWPFARLETPQFTANASWSLDDLCGYLATWSSARRFAAQTNRDSLALVAPELERAWGPRSQNRRVSWQLEVLAGRIG